MKAAEAMTRLVQTVTPDSTLHQALTLMLNARISGLPVVDETGALCGIITEGDLLRRAETGTDQRHRGKLIEFLLGPGRDAREYVEAHSRRVSDLMTVEVATATPGTDLADIVALMERKHIRRVPVVEAGRLVGIVSRADLLRVVGRALARADQTTATPDDVSIERGIRAELKRTHWMAAENISIESANGVVTLDGTIFDEHLRAALRVAAENVPGVTRVVDKLVTLDPATGLYYA